MLSMGETYRAVSPKVNTGLCETWCRGRGRRFRGGSAEDGANCWTRQSIAWLVSWPTSFASPRCSTRLPLLCMPT
jgi:hypothetical protein